MNFANIEFEPHFALPNAKQGRITLTNGLTVSVVGGDRLYGDGETTFEVAAKWSEKEWVKLDEYDDVLGWQTPDQINQLIVRLSKLSPGQQIRR